MSLRVVHVIAGMPVGGAEQMLLGLSSAGRKEGLDSTVICLAAPGPMSESFEQQGIAVTYLGLRSVWWFPTALGRLASRIQQARPDVVQGWMYHGNIAALFASRSKDVPVAWNIRQSLHRPDLFKVTTRLMIRANAAFSSRASSIIYNSNVARQQHEAVGFNRDIGKRIPNGVDIDRFQGRESERSSVRQDLGIRDDETVVISVGRVHPIKAHNIFMESACSVIAAEEKVRFLVVGQGASWDARPFADYRADQRMQERVRLLGERNDVADLLAAADLFVSSSVTEGFPNAVAEAMAAGLPCVVTDVGDSGILIDEFGVVVRPGDADALASGILQIARTSRDDRREMGAGANNRIRCNYSMASMAQQYAQLYRQLATQLPAASEA